MASKRSCSWAKSWTLAHDGPTFEAFKRKITALGELLQKITLAPTYLAFKQHSKETQRGRIRGARSLSRGENAREKGRDDET